MCRKRSMWDQEVVLSVFICKRELNVSNSYFGPIVPVVKQIKIRYMLS